MRIKQCLIRRAAGVRRESNLVFRTAGVIALLDVRTTGTYEGAFLRHVLCRLSGKGVGRKNECFEDLSRCHGTCAENGPKAKRKTDRKRIWRRNGDRVLEKRRCA